MNVNGQVAATARNGTGFKIGEQWYNIAQGQPMPKRGDTVTFVNTQYSDGKMYAEQVQITPGQGGGWSGGGKRNSFQKDPADKYGPIIGHNILIAATILGEEGKDLDTLFTLVKGITERSEKLVQAYTAHKTQPQPAAPATPPPAQAAPAPAPAAQPAPEQATPAVAEFNDDIPW
jgi:hypothetical protein